MKKEFVMRGKTAAGATEILNFSGHKAGYAYVMTEFQLYPSSGLGSNHYEITGSVTAGKTATDPTQPDFDDEGLIAVAYLQDTDTPAAGWHYSIVNDTFLITQNLILMVQDTEAGVAINWQCRFKTVKMSGPEEASTNYKQFSISDGS